MIALFENTGVLSPVELASRYEVYSEQYILSIEVEAKLVSEMATTMIYPAAIEPLNFQEFYILGFKSDYQEEGR